MNTRVLYLGPADMTSFVRERLAGHEVVRADETTVDAELATADAVLDASMRVRFDAARISKAARLALYVTATTGADHVDGEALRRRGAPLLTLRGETEVLRGVTAAAEHSWLLVLACARRLRGAVADVLDGTWERERHPGLMLRGRTLGILGCGRIGQWMARYATAFGMRCVGYDPHVEPWPEGIERASFDEVVAAADVLTVHVPLTDATRRLVDDAAVARMRPGVVLVNTSRGEVLDEDAVLRGLEAGRIGALGLDVLAGEPDVRDHPLVRYARAHDNVVITPHIGGFSPDAVRHVLAFSCDRIARFAEGKRAP